jgi:predicted metalloprotease
MLIVRKIFHIGHHVKNRVGLQKKVNQNSAQTIAVIGSNRQNNTVEPTFTQ